MPWKPIQRLTAGINVREEHLQAIFDAWPASSTLLAGVPNWLMKLGAPQLPRRAIAAFGYKFTPDVLWRSSAELVVAELKYGTNHEPIAIGEVLHHRSMLRRHHPASFVVPLIVCQYNGWVRAAVNDIGAGLRHVEVDLLEHDGAHLAWLSNPHAEVQLCTPPPEIPLGPAWRAKKWWKVHDEPTWLSARDTPVPPFVTGPILMVSELRGRQGEYVFWNGTMPAFGDSEWGKTAGQFCVGAGDKPPPFEPGW